jgi:hypothetical protein
MLLGGMEKIPLPEPQNEHLFLRQIDVNISVTLSQVQAAVEPSERKKSANGGDYFKIKVF